MLADWQAITPPDAFGDRNVRLADSNHPLDFRIGRDGRSRYLFQLDASKLPKQNLTVPRLSGIDCTVEMPDEGRTRLVLVLQHSSDFRNFALMCTGLMLATDDLHASDSAAGMQKTIEELLRWQEMLKRCRERTLSKNERIGLMGELFFLRDVLQPRMGYSDALKSWNGPNGHEQDFVIADNIFEVKTQMVTSDRRIKISSEDQLDPVQGQILIANQGIAPIPPTEANSRTLNSLVAEIRYGIGRSGDIAPDLFEIALLKAGYEERGEYDDESWIIVDRAFYEVSGNFPRIERADLRPGVEMVKYSIRVTDCVAYAVDVDDTMKRLLG